MKFNLVLGLGILMGVIGASMLVALGVLYVKPYTYVTTMQSAVCSTSIVFAPDKPVSCVCGSGGTCTSKYPCINIYVNLSLPGSSEMIPNVTLYDSYDTYLLQRNVRQCAYHKCSQFPAENFNAVKEFAERYSTPGTTYPCFYEPNSTEYAIMDVVSMTTVIHCMLWPSLALVIGLTILCVYINDPKQAKFHHFGSLERPWVRQQGRYEYIIDPETNTRTRVPVDNAGVPESLPVSPT